MNKKLITQKKPATKKKVVSTKTEKAKIIEQSKRFKDIIEMIEDQGFSLRKALKINKLSSQTFYKWIDENPELAKQYARGCEKRADALVEEILDIADDTNRDTIRFTKDGVEREIPDVEWIQRSKLRVDTRKWLASKLNPKKYGERIEVAGDKENPLQVTVFQLPDNKRD